MTEEKEGKKAPSKSRFGVLFLVLVVCLAAGSYALWRVVQARPETAGPAGMLQSSSDVLTHARLTGGFVPDRVVNPLINPAHITAAEPQSAVGDVRDLPDMSADDKPPLVLDEMEPEMPAPEPEMPEPIIAAQLTPIAPVPITPEPIAEMPSRPPVPVSALLHLREAIRGGRPCRDEMQTLMFHHSEQHALIEELKSFCLTNANPYEQLRIDFARYRRQILLAYYRSEKPWWVGYAKYAGALFVDIRAQRPAGDSVPDILDAAANALEGDDMPGALTAVAKLPAAAQDDLEPFKAMLEKLVRVQRMIDEILTQQAGGKND